MRKITTDELKTICEKHIKWLRDEEGGERANLSGSNLSCSDLSCSNLSGSDLSCSNLSCSNLSCSNLSGSNLSCSENASFAKAMTYIVPEGSIIGWKKVHCDSGYCIVKLRIPEEAKRSNATGRKCRAEWAEVIEIIGATEGWSDHTPKTYYRAGEKVMPDSFDDNRWDECSNGIHFFITREEAEAYSP